MKFRLTIKGMAVTGTGVSTRVRDASTIVGPLVAPRPQIQVVDSRISIP